MSRLGVLRKYGYSAKTQKDGSSDKGLDVLTSGQFLDCLSAGRNNACTMYEGELSLDLTRGLRNAPSLELNRVRTVKKLRGSIYPKSTQRNADIGIKMRTRILTQLTDHYLLVAGGG